MILEPGEENVRIYQTRVAVGEERLWIRTLNRLQFNVLTAKQNERRKDGAGRGGACNQRDVAYDE